MNNIISFCGHKASGKDTCGLFIFGSYLCSLGLVEGGFTIKPEGLWVTDIMGNKDLQGRFDPRRNTDTMRNFLAEYVDPYIKLYSFADELKSFCINVLGLTHEQCYGTNNDKNSLTHLKWENMPGCMSWQNAASMCNMYGVPQDIKCVEKMFKDRGIILNQTEMTAREVLQYFGTEIVRKMYSPAWAKATLNKIKREQPLLAIITDCRFEDELDEVKNNGGKVIKLLRQPHQDNHASEQINIADDKFDAIIDNTNLTIDEQNDKLIEILTKWELLPQMEILG
jgi:hypothetical protein